MTKAELIEAVLGKVSNLTRKEAANSVDVVFDTMKETLGRGESIKISAFGNFVVRDKQARKGRNPQTGKAIKIPARKVARFKPGSKLADAVK